MALNCFGRRWELCGQSVSWLEEVYRMGNFHSNWPQCKRINESCKKSLIERFKHTCWVSAITRYTQPDVIEFVCVCEIFETFDARIGVISYLTVCNRITFPKKVSMSGAEKKKRTESGERLDRVRGRTIFQKPRYYIVFLFNLISFIRKMCSVHKTQWHKLFIEILFCCISKNTMNRYRWHVPNKYIWCWC